MNDYRTPRRFTPSQTLFALLVGTILSGLSTTVHAQLYVGDGVGRTIREYNPNTGQLINASFITGSAGPILISGNLLYARDYGADSLSEYNATTGAPISSPFLSIKGPMQPAIAGNTLFVPSLIDQNVFTPTYKNSIATFDASTGAIINASFITGLDAPFTVAVMGNSLYVAFRDSISKYDATTGALINSGFITGLNEPLDFTISGNNLYVSNYGSDTVGEYDATTGAAVNASLITGISMPTGIAVAGNNLYVSSFGNNRIGLYDATTGAAINTNFAVGINGSLAVVVPEPGTAVLLMLGAAAFCGSRRRHGRSAD